MEILLVFLLVIAAAALLAVVYVLMIAPRIKRPAVLREYIGKAFAHRGLHDASQDVPENTLAAFARAADNGYGMEFDVRLTKDGVPVVMHDDDLERMTGVRSKISELTMDELGTVRVGGTDQRVPRFEQVLELVGGRVPLIIELKVCGSNHAKLARTVCTILDEYSGPYVIESFDPRLVRWLRGHRPDIVRGQLLEHYRRHGGTQVPAVVDFVIHNQLINCWVRPDFIAANHDDRDLLAMKLARRIYRTPEIDWTVKNQTQADVSRRDGAAYIFEGFIPVPHTK